MAKGLREISDIPHSEEPYRSLLPASRINNMVWGQKMEPFTGRNGQELAFPRWNNELDPGAGRDLRSRMMKYADKLIKENPNRPPTNSFQRDEERFYPEGRYPSNEYLLKNYGPDSLIDPHYGPKHRDIERDKDMYQELLNKEGDHAIERAKILYDVDRRFAQKYRPHQVMSTTDKVYPAGSWGEEDLTPANQ